MGREALVSDTPGPVRMHGTVLWTGFAPSDNPLNMVQLEVDMTEQWLAGQKMNMCWDVDQDRDTLVRPALVFCEAPSQIFGRGQDGHTPISFSRFAASSGRLLNNSQSRLGVASTVASRSANQGRGTSGSKMSPMDKANTR